MTRDSKERRDHKRFQAAYPVEYSSTLMSDVFTIQNISKGGLAFLYSGEEEPKGEITIRLFFRKKMFLLEAKVMYAVPINEKVRLVGIKLTDLPSDFECIFDKEIKETLQYQRDYSVYNDRDITFRQASKKYIKGKFPDKK